MYGTIYVLKEKNRYVRTERIIADLKYDRFDSFIFEEKASFFPESFKHRKKD